MKVGRQRGWVTRRSAGWNSSTRPWPARRMHVPRGTLLEEQHVHDYWEMVVSDPKVMMGKPVIAGTRITVELILEKLAAAETAEQLVDAHPRLTENAVRAALAFAAGAPSGRCRLSP